MFRPLCPPKPFFQTPFKAFPTIQTLLLHSIQILFLTIRHLLLLLTIQTLLLLTIQNPFNHHHTPPPPHLPSIQTPAQTPSKTPAQTRANDPRSVPVAAGPLQNPINSPMVISCRCGLPAVLREVRQGKNVGRRFYCCSKPRDQQCNFFVWADDPQASNPQPNPTLFASPPANTMNRGNNPGFGGYSNPMREMSEVTCFKCGKLGHLATNCPNSTKRKRNQSTGQETNARAKENGEIGETNGTSGESEDFGRNEE